MKPILMDSSYLGYFGFFALLGLAFFQAYYDRLKHDKQKLFGENMSLKREKLHLLDQEYCDAIKNGYDYPKYKLDEINKLKQELKVHDDIRRQLEREEWEKQKGPNERY
jgi:hypothetical protein